MADLIRAHSEKHLAEVAELFREYADWLAIGSCGANIDREVEDFPGQYGPPGGCLLLARQDDRPVGCVALRRFEDEICEMKRLHVRQPDRGRGLGEVLVVEIIAEARRLGYEFMRLDTIAERMPEAVALYRSLGFNEIRAYGSHPEGCTTFMEFDLRTCGPSPKASRGC